MLPNLVIVEEYEGYNFKYKNLMTCQSCNNIQSCNRSHSFICENFEPYNIPGEKPPKSKSLCSGCYNSHYDHGIGLRQSGGKGCWSYKDAKVILEAYPYNSYMRPPWPARWRQSVHFSIISKRWKG